MDQTALIFQVTQTTSRGGGGEVDSFINFKPAQELISLFCNGLSRTKRERERERERVINLPPFEIPRVIFSID